MRLISHSVKETMALGSALARRLKKGDLVALSGIFGAGKTYFTKGIARGLGIKKWREVTSPSFILCNIYQGKRLSLYHLDAQRLNDGQEILRLGLEEYMDSGICVIEWADKCPPLRRTSPQLREQPHIIRIKFELKGRNERVLKFSGDKTRISGIKPGLGR